MGVGRFICVALPFILTGASIVALLIAGLVGVTSNPSLYMFRVNTTDLSISPLDVASFLKLTTREAAPVEYHDPTLLSTIDDGTTSKATGSGSTTSASGATSNITAADLGLKDYYDINLWGYCSTDSAGNRNCTKAMFNWADTYLNTTSIVTVGSDAGVNVTFPSTITNSLSAFKAVSKWTEVVFIIALVALGLELILGAFTYCSRAISCITYLLSGVASAAVIAAAALVTASSVIVIGAVDSTAKLYGVTGSINTGFLACVWISAAFAMAASFFWIFTVCCCKREHHSHRRSGREDEKPFLAPAGGAYAPIHDNNVHGYNQPQYGVPRHQATGPRSDLAYEPYSHSNV